MAATHSAAALQASTDAVTALLGGDNAALIFRISPSSVASPGSAVATLTFSATPFGAAASSGIATANSITSDTSAAGNASPVAYATMEDSAGTVVVHLEVSASGKDIDMSNGLTVASGDTVSCSSLTYQAISA